MKFGPAALVDLPKLHLDWYAWTMQGGPRPDFLKKHVAYYVTGKEAWRYADTLQGVTKDMRPFYLDSVAGRANECSRADRWAWRWVMANRTATAPIQPT
jgi:hypothetical protein